MDSTQIKFRLCKDSVQYLIQDLFIDAKWRRTAAHAHRSAFGFACRVDANGNLRAAAEPPANDSDALGFWKRLHVDLTDAACEHQFEFCLGFPGTGKQDAFRRAAGIQCFLELAG